MLTALPEIDPKDDLSATYMRRLVRYVRSITPIQGPGIMLARGPNGTVFSGNPCEKKPVSKRADVGRFAIVWKRDPDVPSAPAVRTMVNCYFDVGGKTYLIDDIPFPPPAGAESDYYYALVINAVGTSVVGYVETYRTFLELQNAQSDRIRYVVPLYKIATDGTVLVDFRVGPSAIMGEF